MYDLRVLSSRQIRAHRLDGRRHGVADARVLVPHVQTVRVRLFRPFPLVHVVEVGAGVDQLIGEQRVHEPGTHLRAAGRVDRELLEGGGAERERSRRIRRLVRCDDVGLHVQQVVRAAGRDEQRCGREHRR